MPGSFLRIHVSSDINFKILYKHLITFTFN